MKWSILYTLCISTILVLSSCGEEEKSVPAAVANKDLDSLISLYPDSVPLLLQRGEMYFAEYEFDLALQDAAKAYRLEKSNQKAKLLYAEVINNRQQRTPDEVAAAQVLYKEIIKKEPKNTRALVGLASTLTYQQDFEKSFEYINKALKIDRHFRSAYVLKGTNYMALGNKEKAISSYETAIQQDPEFYEAYFILANIYEAEGNEICVDYFQNAYELRSSSKEILYRLAFAQDNFGNKEGAVQNYRKLSTDTSDFYSHRGYFHIARIKQFDLNELDSAMYLYRQALQVEPQHVESLTNLGICYNDIGDKEQALRHLSEALRYNPDFGFARKYADSIRFL